MQAEFKSFQEYLAFLKKKAVKLRIDMLEMLRLAESGHAGGSLSAIEMLVALYHGILPSGPIMKYEAEKPGWEGQDYFVLSKAHAAPALYAVLADIGFFPSEEMHHLRKMNALLQAFPMKKIPGIALDTATPGHGFAASVGLAMSLKMEKQQNHVYCLLGDGELQDGLVWEAAMVASHNKLDNLTLMIDRNDLQMDGLVRGIVGIEPIADKFQSFGWKIIPVLDGHDFEELLFAYERALENQRRPSVIIARTVKGKGVAFTEGKAFYHAEVLSEQEMDEAIPKLKAELITYEK